MKQPFYAMVIVALSYISPSPFHQTDKENVVRKESFSGLYAPPFHIQEIRVNGRAESPGIAFEAEEGWLYKLRVKVRNHSERTLRYVEIRVEFLPHTIAPQRLSKGHHFPYSPTASDGEDLVLRPGEETVLAWPEAHVKWLKEECAEYGKYMIKNVMLTEVRAVYDGTGCKFQPSQNSLRLMRLKAMSLNPR